MNKVEVEVEKDQEQGDEIEFTIKNLSGRGTKRWRQVFKVTGRAVVTYTNCQLSFPTAVISQLNDKNAAFAMRYW